MISFARFSYLSRRPGIWLLLISVMVVQLLINQLFSFAPDVLTLLWMAIILLLLLAGGTLILSYFTNKPAFRRRLGLALTLPFLLYLQLSVQPPNQYGVRPITEVRGAVNATLRYDGLSQQQLNQKPGAPYALRTALLHKYRDEVPEFSWLIGFDYDRPATLSSSGFQAEDVNRFYLFNLRNQQAGSNHPNMINARLQAEPQRFVIDIAHDMADFRYEIPLFYERAQPIPVQGYALSDPSLRATAAVYIHLTDPARHSRFQQLYYRFLNAVYGPNPIT